MVDDESMKEVVMLLRSINDKLNASGIGLLAEADAAVRIEELLKLLAEPKVVDLIYKLTQLLDAISKVNPTTIMLISALIGCISPTLDANTIINAPRATLMDLINQLNEEDTQHMLGLLVQVIRQASACMKELNTRRSPARG